MAQDREEYKERMRAAGRRALEDFRRQKVIRATVSPGPGSGSGSGPGSGSGLAAHLPPSVELTTFRVMTRPAAATAGPVPPPEPAELRLLAPAMVSTSLGALPPGSSCLLPPLRPPSSSPCSVTSAAGCASVSSVGSTATGFVTATTSVETGTSAGTSPRPAGGHLAAAAAEDEDARLQQMSRGASLALGRAGSADQAMVDMLLSQVEALMRDKASLAAENVGLRQQVEQLTELVGWLSLERGGPEGETVGYGAEIGETGDELDMSYGLSPPRALRDFGIWQVQGDEGHGYEGSAGSEVTDARAMDARGESPSVSTAESVDCDAGTEGVTWAGSGLERVSEQLPQAVGAATVCDDGAEGGTIGLGDEGGDELQAVATTTAGCFDGSAVEEMEQEAAQAFEPAMAASAAAPSAAAPVMIQGGPLGPLGPLGPGG